MSPADPTGDATLARRAAEGDEDAFADLVRRHKAPLYHLLRRYTGNGDEAHEAAQEAFIAAWGAIRRYDPTRPFLSWLRTIAINKARDRLRRAAFRRLLFGAGLESASAREFREPAVAADEAMIDRETVAMLERALARLPPALKGPLLLTAFEGLSQREAGEVLGISAKAVETRTRRARQRLALTLKSPPGPDA